ncbi:MAG: MFS transporter [Pseudomonadota bacterium]
MSTRRAAALTAAYFAMVFGALGAHAPYWPGWLADWGLSEAEIGRYMGLAIIARIAGATLLPTLADRWAARRAMVTLTALATAAVYAAHAGVEGRGALLVLTLIAAVTMAPGVPVGDALSIRAAAAHGFAYAPVRAVGSIAFLLVNVGIGAGLAWVGQDLVLWVIVAGNLGLALFGALHPGGGAAAVGAAERARPGEIRALALNPILGLFALVLATGQSGHVVYYVYSVLDWRAQGIADPVIGALWATGVIVETALMLGPGRRWVERLGAPRALALAATAGVLRWAAMAWVPPDWALWPLQALHALTFGIAHLAAIAFVAAAIPHRLSASAQGIAAGAVAGGVMAAVAFGAAEIVAQADIASAYLLAAGLSVLSLVLAVLLARIWQGGMLPGLTPDSESDRRAP